MNFFRREIYCYANFLLFSDQISEGEVSEGSKLPQGGAPIPSVEESQ